MASLIPALSEKAKHELLTSLPRITEEHNKDGSWASEEQLTLIREGDGK